MCHTTPLSTTCIFVLKGEREYITYNIYIIYNLGLLSFITPLCCSNWGIGRGVNCPWSSSCRMWEQQCSLGESNSFTRSSYHHSDALSDSTIWYDKRLRIFLLIYVAFGPKPSLQYFNTNFASFVGCAIHDRMKKRGENKE